MPLKSKHLNYCVVFLYAWKNCQIESDNSFAPVFWILNHSVDMWIVTLRMDNDNCVQTDIN